MYTDHICRCMISNNTSSHETEHHRCLLIDRDGMKQHTTSENPGLHYVKYTHKTWEIGFPCIAQRHAFTQVGLPPASKNASTWPLKKLLLGNVLLKPSPELIAQTHTFFQSMLRLRYSSPLFRLPTSDSICSQVCSVVPVRLFKTCKDLVSKTQNTINIQLPELCKV